MNKAERRYEKNKKEEKASKAMANNPQLRKTNYLFNGFIAVLLIVGVVITTIHLQKLEQERAVIKQANYILEEDKKLQSQKKVALENKEENMRTLLKEEQKSITLATLRDELSSLRDWDHENQKKLRKLLNQEGIFDNFSEIRYNCHSMEKTERELSYIARNEFETTEEYKQRQYKTNYSAFEKYFSRDVLMNVKYINKYNADQKRFESDIRSTNFDDKADFLQESKPVYNNSKYDQSDCYFRFINLDQLMLDLPMERELAKISKDKIRIMILFSFNEAQGAIDLDYSRTEGYVKTQNYFIKVKAKAVIFYMDNKLLKSIIL